MWPLYNRTYFLVKNLRRPQCRNLEKVLRAQPGVLDVDVSLQASRAAITSRPGALDLDGLVAAAAADGCDMLPLVDPRPIRMQLDQEHRFIQLVVALVFGMQVIHMWMNLMPRYMAGNFTGPDTRYLQWWSLALATALLFYGGLSYLRGSWLAIRDGRLSWDYLWATIALGLYGYSLVSLFSGQGWTLFGPLAVLTILVSFGRFAGRYMLQGSEEDDTEQEPAVEQ